MNDKITIDRATYKRIKSFDRNQMQKFISDIYDDAAGNTVENGIFSFDMDKVRKEIGEIKGIGENRLNEIMAIIEVNLVKE